MKSNTTWEWVSDEGLSTPGKRAKANPREATIISNYHYAIITPSHDTKATVPSHHTTSPPHQTTTLRLLHHQSKSYNLDYWHGKPHHHHTTTCFTVTPPVTTRLHTPLLLLVPHPYLAAHHASTPCHHHNTSTPHLSTPQQLRRYNIKITLI